MTKYVYNQEMFDIAKSVINSVENGKEVLVIINNEIFEDCYLENKMFAKIIGVKIYENDIDNDGKQIIDYEFTMDFSDFDLENQKKESHSLKNPKTGQYTLTSTEAGFKPKDLKETVLHSITHGKLFFDLPKGDLINEYIKEKKEVSYVEWLENIILKSRV
jgi:hypothetical protein